MHPDRQGEPEFGPGQVNRRDFLGKGLYAAAGLVGLGAIAGCGDGSAASGGDDPDVQKAYNAFVKKEMPGVPMSVLQGAAKEGTLNAYMLVPEYNKDVVQAFEQTFPFVTVQPTYINGGPLVAKFLAEVRSSKALADVVQFSSLSDAMDADKQGYIKPYKLTVESKVSMSSGVKGKIYPVTGEVLTICYNPEKVKDSDVSTLQKWDGVLDPKWDQATFAVGEVLAGGTTQLVNYYLYKTSGTKVWERIAKAGHGIYPGGNPEITTVVSGEHDLAIGVPQSLAVAQFAEGAPVHWTNPKDWLASPYAQFISAKAKNINAAKLFHEFTFTPTAQSIMGGYGGISYVKGVKASGDFAKESWYQPVDSSQYWSYSAQDLGAQMPSIAKQWRSIIK